MTNMFDRCYELSQSGNSNAQYALGTYYKNGIECEKNVDAAKYWFKTSMENGNIEAAKEYLQILLDSNNKGELEQAFMIANTYAFENDPYFEYSLGVMYRDGIGIERNLPMCLTWLRKSSDLGYSKATIALIDILQVSNNQSDRREAYIICKNLAKANNTYAQYRLGIMYLSGIGTKKDENEAKALLFKSLSNGYPKASVNLASMSLSDEENERLYELCSQYKKDKNATYVVAKLCIDGKITGKSHDEIIDLLRKSSEMGNSKATIALIDLLIVSANQPDRREAFLLCLPLAKSGNSYAQYRLAKMYHNGKGTSKNYSECMKWVEKSAIQNNSRAICLYIDYLMEDSESDLSKAVKLCVNSAKKGDKYTQFKLGELYLNGVGVEKDLVESKKWFLKAYQSGNEKALDYIDGCKDE